MAQVEREFHEVANIFPLINGDEFVSLVSDIEENGLHEAIWLHPDGSIIDGRNRYRACMQLGVEPTYRKWDGSGSLVRFVLSLNLHRRHLDASQRAFVGLDAKRELEKEIAEEKREKGRQAALMQQERKRQEKRDAAGQVSLIESEPESERVRSLLTEPSRHARDEAAAMTNVANSYISTAERLDADAPDLAEQVRSGEMTITKAKREMVQREKIDAPPLPTEGKYRVVYADPPWNYGNSGLDGYGHAERHYPTMTISELCDLDVEGMTEDDAVLFMWVTSPLLEECFPVIKAWGFKYKTSFVWDKVKHNYGHYNSVRHELLLVCTRGSCTPDAPKLFDSVQSIERTSKHSEKPQEFRGIIDTIYPNGRRVEMFARADYEGWDTWGNE